MAEAKAACGESQQASLKSLFSFPSLAAKAVKDRTIVIAIFANRHGPPLIPVVISDSDPQWLHGLLNEVTGCRRAVESDASSSMRHFAVTMVS